MPRSPSSAAVIALLVGLGLAAFPRPAHAEIAVFAFNADAEALELLQDADGFVVLNEKEGKFDFHADAMMNKVYNTAMRRCGKNGITAFVALDFGNHLRVISRSCSGLTAQTSTSNEQTWKDVIEQTWPKFLWKHGASHEMWLGLVLNRAYNEYEPSACEDYVLENLLDDRWLDGIPAQAKALTTMTVTLCAVNGRPIAPLADVGIIGSGFDKPLSKVLADLADRQLLLARRLARLLLVRARTTTASVEFHSVSGDWTTDCTLTAVGATSGFRVKVKAKCTATSSSAPGSHLESNTTLLQKSPAETKAASSWDAVESFSDTGKIENGVLLAGMDATTDWRLAVLHRTSYRARSDGGADPKDVTGGASSPAQSFLKAKQGRDETRVYYRFVEENDQCRFWFVSGAARVTINRRGNECKPSTQNSVGAEVYAAECSCAEVKKMVDTNRWELEVK